MGVNIYVSRGQETIRSFSSVIQIDPTACSSSLRAKNRGQELGADNPDELEEIIEPMLYIKADFVDNVNLRFVQEPLWPSRLLNT